MRVLLNFLPLMGRGGGRQNAMNLWAAMGRHDGAGHGWLAVTRPNLDLAAPPDGAAMEQVTLAADGFRERLEAENVALPRLARTFGADVIFTPMGAGPLRSTVPRVVGWHDGTSVYPESPMWAGHSAATLVPQRLRTAYAGFALRGAGRVCVQTATMGRRVVATFGVDPSRLRVVSNGLSAFLVGEEPAGEAPPSPRRILVVTTDQPAKNLEALPRIARALGDLGVRDAEIVATLSPEGGARAMGVSLPFSGAGSGSGDEGTVVVPGPVPVRCVGAVPHAELGAFYRQGSVVVVPSWVESFTAVFPEAWHFGVPVVASDLDFARGLCGSGAAYAPPDRPRLFAEVVAKVLADAPLRTRLRDAGRERLALLPDWDQRFALYLAALEQAVGIS